MYKYIKTHCLSWSPLLPSYQAFKDNGFSVIFTKDSIDQLEAGTMDVNTMTDTLILMPSAELSRARGGFHCMSMPLLREKL